MACQSDPFCCQRYGCGGPPPCHPLPCLPLCPVTPELPGSATFQATAQANQSLTAATATQVLFQYPTVGNAVAYTPFTSVFQAPSSGLFRFTVILAWRAVATGNSLQLSLNVAGLNALTTTSFYTLGLTPNQATAALDGIVALLAGQTVTVQALGSAASTVLGQVPAPTALSWFAGNRV